MKERFGLPVAVIGAGPIGLAAAAHLARHGESFVVLEAGPAVGCSVRQWGHVLAKALLAAADWQGPDEHEIPTGHAWVERGGPVQSDSFSGFVSNGSAVQAAAASGNRLKYAASGVCRSSAVCGRRPL